MKNILYVVLIILLSSYSPLIGQEETKTQNTVEFSINQGRIWYTENDVAANTTRAELKLSFCERNPSLCPSVSINWMRILERIDIPPFPPIIVRPWPLPLPPTDPWEIFDFCLIEYGVSNIVTLDIGVERNLNDKLSLGLSAGLGFESVSRNTTSINDANFTVTNMSNPVLSYGAEVSYDISNRFSASLNAGMLNSYWGDISILADDGSSIVIEGSTLKAPNVSLGISVGI
jgi:hypothetical protein